MKSLELFAVSDLETGYCFGLFFTEKEAEECQISVGVQGSVEKIEMEVKDEHVAIFKKLIKKGK